MNMDTACSTEKIIGVGWVFLHHCLTFFHPVLLPLPAAPPVHLAIEGSNTGTKMGISHFLSLLCFPAVSSKLKYFLLVNSEIHFLS